MEFPITVQKIESNGSRAYFPKLLFGGKCGDMVAVRPVAKEHEGKTFLGILLGEIATNVGYGFSSDTGTLTIGMGMRNPAIFVPDLNKVIFGYESWWGRIASAEQLRQITDEDINNVWYVQALKQLEADAAQ